MVPSRTGWRIVTLAVAVYAAASAGDPLNARTSSRSRPPTFRAQPVARDAQTGGRLVWGAPVPPAYVPSASAVDPAPANAPPIQEPLPAAPSPSMRRPNRRRARAGAGAITAGPIPCRRPRDRARAGGRAGVAGRAARDRRRRGAARGGSSRQLLRPLGRPDRPPRSSPRPARAAPPA